MAIRSLHSRLLTFPVEVLIILAIGQHSVDFWESVGSDIKKQFYFRIEYSEN